MFVAALSSSPRSTESLFESLERVTRSYYGSLIAFIAGLHLPQCVHVEAVLHSVVIVSAALLFDPAASASTRVVVLLLIVSRVVAADDRATVLIAALHAISFDVTFLLFALQTLLLVNLVDRGRLGFHTTRHPGCLEGQTYA